MKYSVKLIIKNSVESGEIFFEESIIMLDADSFDEAYIKAERYVEDNGICSSYENMFGKLVTSEVVSYADCFSVYDDEDAIEVYSNVIKCGKDMPEETAAAFFTNTCTREDLLPLRQWPDADMPEEKCES